MDYVLYTDGAYSSARNQGGIGFIILKNEECIIKYSKMYKNTTNNQMEILAVILGLKCFKNNINSLTIITDSQYVIGCATKNWKRKKNKKLWELFDKVYKDTQSKCVNITWKWTPGHASNKWNNICDELAVNASHEI